MLLGVVATSVKLNNLDLRCRPNTVVLIIVYVQHATLGSRISRAKNKNSKEHSCDAMTTICPQRAAPPTIQPTMLVTLV